MDVLTPQQIRDDVMPTMLANYRGWHILAQCGHCVRTVQQQRVEDVLTRYPGISVAQMVHRLRCRFSQTVKTSCGQSPRWVAIEAASEGVRYVLRSRTGG